MICFENIKFKQVLYENHINKYVDLNEQIHQQVQRCKTSEDLAIKDSF